MRLRWKMNEKYFVIVMFKIFSKKTVCWSLHYTLNADAEII